MTLDFGHPLLIVVDFRGDFLWNLDFGNPLLIVADFRGDFFLTLDFGHPLLIVSVFRGLCLEFGLWPPPPDCFSF